MKNIEDLISPLIQSQFPSFYNEEGELFIEFVKAYYKWLETNNQQLYYSRNLLEYKDIDKTVDSFIVHFKETYLKDLPFNTSADSKLLLKNILRFYHNKGDESSVKMAIRALFNQDSSVYLPGDDIFKLSSGKWMKPKYLEVTASPRNETFVNKEIVGVYSQARALCEGFVKKRVYGKLIDVLYISNLQGNFLYGEQVVEVSNTNIDQAPSVIGSLTSLVITNGGQGFSEGDIFDIRGDNGKNGKAIVTKISNETGRIDFSVIYGGWGFSVDADVLVSDKVLGLANVTNANNLVTDFTDFETVSQNLMSIGYSSAIDSSIFVANTRLFAEGNTSVSNVYAGVVANNIITTTTGIVKVTNLTGNIVSTNTTFKADLVDVGFTTSADISLFTNGSVIETVNSTSTSNAYIIVASNTSLSNGNFLVRPISGNLASTNTIIRLVSNNSTQANLISYTSNHYFTASVANNSDITAEGYLIGQNTTHIGLETVLNMFIPNTIYSYVRGISSNTYANLTFVGSGSAAAFVVGDINMDETVQYNTEILNSNNVGSISYLNINLDLSPNNANAAGYGFPKHAAADLNTVLLSALTFESKQIGRVTSLNLINPGQDYNIDPFVLIYEKPVASFMRKDFLFPIANLTGSFVAGERVVQIYNANAVILTVDNFAGLAANGDATSTFEIGEGVYQSNGTANIATGIVFSTALVGGSGSVKLYNTTGTFENTSISGYQVVTMSTNATCNVSFVNTATSITQTAKGEIKEGSNNTFLKITRISFENDFGPGNTVIGLTSGATANLQYTYIDEESKPIGGNAIVGANVQTANATVSGIRVVDSGFGYLDKENLTLTKPDSIYVVTAQTRLQNEGFGEGYYADAGGFLSDTKRIFDNDYYQDYSYEIQSKLSFSKYSDILKKLLHVAGTKMFGKTIIDSISNNEIQSVNDVTTTSSINFTNATTSKTFSNSEFVIFSNGSSNSTLHHVNSTSLSTSLNSSNNIVVIQIPDSNNNFVVNRFVYSPNSTSVSASGNLVAKSSNSSANISLLYIKVSNGTFSSSNTIAGFISSNTSNTTTTISTLSYAVNVTGYGNIHSPTISTITVPVTNTLSSMLSGTVSVSNSSVNVVGTSTNLQVFAANGWVQFTSGASSDVRQIKSVTNTTHMILRSYPSFTNSVSTIKKSSPFIQNTYVKMPNTSANSAYANLFAIEANSTFFTFYLNDVYGSFHNSNTVEGYINSSTTNTYTLNTSINTLVVVSNQEGFVANSVLTGKTSNTSANVSYATIRLEK
ncbi:hypothetical protein EB118_02990 [bacterium]|nr:hypothetical protein [bacterium]